MIDYGVWRTVSARICAGILPNGAAQCNARSACTAYTHLDSGLLTEDDIAEVETLAQAYYDALDVEDKANAEEITQ